MKILFSNPPWWSGKHMLGLMHESGVRAGSRWPFTQKVFSRPGWRSGFDYTPFPHFLFSAAGYVAHLKPEIEVHVRDSIARKESYKSYFDYVKGLSPQYVVIESASSAWEHDETLIRQLGEILPDTAIIVTGPISSVLNEDYVENSKNIVAVINGEYEKSCIKVLDGARGVFAHDLLTQDEMNASGFPLLDDEAATYYYDRNPKGQKFPQAHVWSTRGCPFKCIFCVWPAVMTGNDPDGSNVRKVRFYSSEYLKEYLTGLIKKYGYKSIYFDDDTFNLGKSHVESIARVMREIGLPWSAMCRPDTIKHETWKVMRESGCFGVKLGFESGNQYVNDQIVNKHLDLERAAETVIYLKSIGMTVHGTFTYGLPGETKKQMLDTKNYIKRLPFDSVQESGAAEIEGSPLHTLSQKGHLPSYTGAQITDEYVRSYDGNQKWKKLIEHLQQS